MKKGQNNLPQLAWNDTSWKSGQNDLIEREFDRNGVDSYTAMAQTLLLR